MNKSNEIMRLNKEGKKEDFIFSNLPNNLIMKIINIEEERKKDEIIKMRKRNLIDEMNYLFINMRLNKDKYKKRKEDYYYSNNLYYHFKEGINQEEYLNNIIDLDYERIFYYLDKEGDYLKYFEIEYFDDLNKSYEGEIKDFIFSRFYLYREKIYSYISSIITFEDYY